MSCGGCRKSGLKFTPQSVKENKDDFPLNESLPRWDCDGLSASIFFHPMEKRCVFKPEAFGDPEFSIELPAGWSCVCDQNIHTPLISEIPPNFGLTLSDPSGRNSLRMIYQYGVPTWTFPLADSEDQLVTLKQGGRGRLAILREGESVRLQLLFFEGQAQNYTVTGTFDRDFYDQNEALIRRGVTSVSLR